MVSATISRRKQSGNCYWQFGVWCSQDPESLRRVHSRYYHSLTRHITMPLYSPRLVAHSNPNDLHTGPVYIRWNFLFPDPLSQKPLRTGGVCSFWWLQSFDRKLISHTWWPCVSRISRYYNKDLRNKHTEVLSGRPNSQSRYNEREGWNVSENCRLAVRQHPPLGHPLPDC